MKSMKRMLIVAPIGLAFLAAACGETTQQRATTGAASGAAVGAVAGGPVGAVVGAGAGAVGGAYRDEADTTVDRQADKIASDEARSSGAQPAATRSGMHEGPQLRNEDVRDAQTALQDLGLYDGQIDGLYGRQTIGAVSEFQARQGIPRTGALDRRTMDDLQAVAGDPAAQPMQDRQVGEQPLPNGAQTPTLDSAPADRSRM